MTDDDLVQARLRLDRALKAAHEDGECEREREWEEVIVECFNPPDCDSYDGRSCVEAAHAFIVAQPCKCTPEMIADWDACARCHVLGRRGDKAIER